MYSQSKDHLAAPSIRPKSGWAYIHPAHPLPPSLAEDGVNFKTFKKNSLKWFPISVMPEGEKYWGASSNMWG